MFILFISSGSSVTWIFSKAFLNLQQYRDDIAGIDLGRKIMEGTMQIDEIYELYYPKIYNYVYYRLMNRERTEDIVSSVFIKVITCLDTYDEQKASLATWIFKIAQNTLTDYYRMNRQTASTEEMEYEGRVEFEGEEKLLREETNREVYRLLMHLSEAERELVFLKYYEELRNKRIGELLGMTETAVSTKLSRIMHKLRDVMTPDEYMALKE